MGKDDKTKVGGIKTTGIRDGVEKTEKAGSIGAVEKAQKAAAVGKVKNAGSIQKRGTTRIMSSAERQALFDMITEEADKLFEKSAVPKSQRKVVEDAVKMAVDAALIDSEYADDEEGGGEQS